jgi:hypothetical protein
VSAAEGTRSSFEWSDAGKWLRADSPQSLALAERLDQRLRRRRAGIVGI